LLGPTLLPVNNFGGRSDLWFSGRCASSFACMADPFAFGKSGGALFFPCFTFSLAITDEAISSHSLAIGTGGPSGRKFKTGSMAGPLAYQI
jgi:hypothetical protein